jgi:hypothetical protein
MFSLGKTFIFDDLVIYLTDCLLMLYCTILNYRHGINQQEMICFFQR